MFQWTKLTSSFLQEIFSKSKALSATRTAKPRDNVEKVGKEKWTGKILLNKKKITTTTKFKERVRRKLKRRPRH